MVALQRQDKGVSPVFELVGAGTHLGIFAWAVQTL